MNRWLVTGATGLFGSNAGQVLARDPSIHAMALTRSKDLPRHFHECVVGDLMNAASVKSAVNAAQPNVIVHAAALASHEECEKNPDLAAQINVEGTRALLEAARDLGSLVIFISTDAVFDGKTGHYSEKSLTNPFSVYGQTKREAEKVVGTYENSLIIRTNFFGWSPSGTRSILEFFVNNLTQKNPVRGFTDFIVTSIYAPQLIEILLKLSSLEHRGTVHVGSRDALTKYEFGVTVARTFGLDDELILPTSSTAVGLETPRSRDLSLDVSLVEELLGASVPSQAEGIAAAYQDWRTQT